MSLIKVKRFAQVTLPPDLRKKFNLAEGDYLEAEAVEEGILLKPVTVVERKKAWEQLLGTIDKVQGPKSRNRKAAKEAEEEIAAIVKESRKR